MKPIARKCFLVLCKDYSAHNHYVVYEDGNKFAEFWADNDTDARYIFEKGEY